MDPEELDGRNRGEYDSKPPYALYGIFKEIIKILH